MNAKDLYKKLVFLNEKGIPLPLIRDNGTNEGSFTLTMFFISFNVALLALIGKLAGYLGGIDYQNVIWLLGLTGSFYLGKAFVGTGKDGSSVTVEQKKEEV